MYDKFTEALQTLHGPFFLEGISRLNWFVLNPCRNAGLQLLVGFGWCNWLFSNSNASVATSLRNHRWVLPSPIAQPRLLFTYAICVMCRAVGCALLAIICETILGKRLASFCLMRRTVVERFPLFSVRLWSGISVTAIGFTLHKELWIER